MSFETNIQDIRKIVSILSNKDADVYITYRGTALGVVKPWNIKCDTFEINHANHDLAAEELLNSLTVELKKRISSAEKQATTYKEALASIDKDIRGKLAAQQLTNRLSTSDEKAVTETAIEVSKNRIRLEHSILDRKLS